MVLRWVCVITGLTLLSPNYPAGRLTLVQRWWTDATLFSGEKYHLEHFIKQVIAPHYYTAAHRVTSVTAQHN